MPQKYDWVETVYLSHQLCFAAESQALVLTRMVVAWTWWHLGSMWMLVVRSFVLFFFFVFLLLCCFVFLVGVGRWPELGSIWKSMSFQNCTALAISWWWLLAFFCWKEGPCSNAMELPFSVALNSAASKILTFTLIWAAFNRERLGESLLLHPASIISAKFILGAFGANALKINSLRLSHHLIHEFRNWRSDFASIK